MTSSAPPRGPLWVIVGPTASGKTALAVELAKALDGEIVSADSVQIYRHFDIGSGKPSFEERGGVPHHLIDELDPLSHWDAAQFAAAADACIDAIRGRGKVPLVCGGTFLWVRALLFGLAPAPPSDPELRRRHQELAETEGRAAVHAKLATIDPPSAERLSPNDFVRVSRALEVFELTGRPLSALQAEHGFREPRYAPTLIGIQHDKEALKERIASRCREMLARGWVDEVRDLLERGYGESRAMNSVGYRQVALAIQQDITDEEAIHSEVTRATRVFARRQRTWLRDEPVTWLEPELALRSADEILNRLGAAETISAP